MVNTLNDRDADTEFWARKNLQIKSFETAIQILGPSPYNPEIPITKDNIDDVFDTYLEHYFRLSNFIFDSIIET